MQVLEVPGQAKRALAASGCVSKTDMTRLRNALAAIPVIAALAFPVTATAQDELPEVKILIDLGLQATFTEGMVGPFFRAVLKDGQVAPKGGITVGMSWLLSATGRAGYSHNRTGVPITILEGENENATFVAGRSGA